MIMIKCDPRAKAKCPFKDPCCGDDAGYFLEGSDCDKFNQKVCAVPPTNADRIRGMSDEELAEFLCHFRSDDVVEHACSGCKAEPYCCYGHNGMIDWLQQPAEEER